MKIRELPFYIIVIAYQILQKCKSLMKKIMLVVIVLSLVGCANVQKVIFQWDDNNIATTRLIAIQVIKNWDYNSEWVKRHVPMGELSKKAIDALEELDKFKTLHSTESIILTNKEVVGIMSDIEILLEPTTLAVLEKYLPAFLDFLSRIRKFI